MKIFMSICLNKASKIPIYRQLGDALLKLIDDGVLKPETKLPPIRKMASCLKINSSTIVNTYKYLESKSAVYSFHGSGIYVCPPSPIQTHDAPYGEQNIHIAQTAIMADFTAGFKRGFNQKLLTGVLESYLKQEQLKKDDDSVILSASTNVFNVVAKSLINKNDYVIVEKPVSFSRVTPYMECGAKISTVPVGAEGLDICALETVIKMYKPKVLHTCTYFQTPTDACTSLENKKSIIDLCRKHNMWIVEEDTYSDLLDERKVFLKSLDFYSNVVYVKNITKLYLPHMCAYMCVFPKSIAEKVDKISGLYASQNDAVIYEKIYSLFTSHSFNNYVNKIVNNYSTTYSIIAQIIDEKLSTFTEYNKAKTGAGFWIKLKTGTSVMLSEYSAKKGVFIVPGIIYYGCEHTGYFRLCLDKFDTKYINESFSVILDSMMKIT